MRPRLGADGAGAASEHAVPDGLSVITYTAMATPKFSPFIPLYKGLPGDAMPPELAAAPKPGQMDGVSIFWRVRRLQALIFQVRKGRLVG